MSSVRKTKLAMESDDTPPESVRSRRSRFMLALLPVAAVAIVVACVWKLNQTPPERTDITPLRELRPSPTFELPDQKSRMVRLERYLHRHPIVLVFFDGDRGADKDMWLRALRSSADSIARSGTIVLGISMALPRANRETEFPFPLLTDLNPAQPGSTNEVHRQWGVLDEEGRTVPSVFLITRAGLVDWDGQHPRPVQDPAALVRAVMQGRDPEAAQ